jgi:hypothetical protein
LGLLFELFGQKFGHLATVKICGGWGGGVLIKETTGIGFGNLYYISDPSAQSVKVADCKKWAIVHPERDVGLVKEFVNALSSVSPNLGTLIGREGLLVHVDDIFCCCC